MKDDSEGLVVLGGIIFFIAALVVVAIAMLR